MQNLLFTPYSPSDHRTLVHWLCTETWSHYPHGRLTQETARQYVDAGMFHSNSSRTYWVEVEGWQVAGLIRFYRLDTATPTFDLHLTRQFRGRGIGRAAVQWATNRLFDELTEIESITVVTRNDNRPMRRLLRGCAYSESAYHPQMWFDDAGVCYDIVCYTMSREIWGAP